MAKFDPSKPYTWEPNAQFVFNGQEFGLVMTAIRTILSSPEAQKIFLAIEANEIIHNQIAKAVEEGVAVEQEVNN
jgi:hypothetical protein